MWALLSWFWGHALMPSIPSDSCSLSSLPSRASPVSLRGETHGDLQLSPHNVWLWILKKLSRWHKICVKQLFQLYQVPECSLQCCVLPVFSAVLRAAALSPPSADSSTHQTHINSSDSASLEEPPCILTLLPLFMLHDGCPLCMSASCCTKITLKTYDVLNSAQPFCWQCWLAWARRMVAPEIL